MDLKSEKCSGKAREEAGGRGRKQVKEYMGEKPGHQYLK